MPTDGGPGMAATADGAPGAGTPASGQRSGADGSGGAETPASAPNSSSGGGGPLGGAGSQYGPYAVLALAAGLVAVDVVRSDLSPLAALRALPGKVRAVATAVALAVADWLEHALARLRGLSSLRELPGAVRGLVADALRSVWARPWRRDATGERAAETPGPSTTSASPRERVRGAWERLVAAAGVTRYERRTPGDVKRRALAADLPAEPVAAVTRAFRAVEYGGDDPEGHLEPAESAADRIDAAADVGSAGDTAGGPDSADASGEDRYDEGAGGDGA
jgi:hypothetical protein